MNIRAIVLAKYQRAHFGNLFHIVSCSVVTIMGFSVRAAHFLLQEILHLHNSDAVYVTQFV